MKLKATPQVVDGRVNQRKLIRDAALKRKVLQMLESVARGIDRLEAVTKRIDPNTVQALLAKLQAPPLGQVADIKTLQNVLLSLEELSAPAQAHASGCRFARMARSATR